jgi:hypothetical protein
MGKGQTVNFLGQTVKLRETDKYESIVGISKKDGSQERLFLSKILQYTCNRSRKASHVQHTVSKSGMDAQSITIFTVDATTDFIEIEVKKPSGTGMRAKTFEMKDNIFFLFIMTGARLYPK